MARRQSKDPSEYYKTPAWSVHRLAEKVDFSRVASIVDPCAGDGALLDALRPSLPVGLRAVVELDLVPQHPRVVAADGLGPWPVQPEVCIMNPPFSMALPFAQHAVQNSTRVYMLQRLNWLASKERQGWLQANPPTVYVLPNRPDFTGGGGDSHDYAWLAWGEAPGVHVLNLTPKAVRKAQKPP